MLWSCTNWSRAAQASFGVFRQLLSNAFESAEEIEESFPRSPVLLHLQVRHPTSFPRPSASICSCKKQTKKKIPPKSFSHWCSRGSHGVHQLTNPPQFPMLPLQFPSSFIALFAIYLVRSYGCLTESLETKISLVFQLRHWGSRAQLFRRGLLTLGSDYQEVCFIKAMLKTGVQTSQWLH